ncbi:ABC1 kinase family protein [Psychrobacter sanguinis]|uniref:ABC1 kinase family protein n=1 Tax=Psychrobacter sanguinis TaxID=861445 RepID=UPI001918836B|nr:AarF/ABC1/UbiB kinase family protein [Psychrobacter sanguinis]MCC3307924.1 AarF/ABC1/UbiB kinase family protein [Psychrobacter sanguinis]MDY3307580.1 AarF/ABC1/UbiB kinase family protein [Psychrobacter sanguinis]UEC25217.1 AarF/ABC1/UbiB kinase family protein [Psychrobacter sanguinis]
MSNSSSSTPPQTDLPQSRLNNEMSELKTSRLDRRLSMAKTSLNLGRRWAGNSFSGLFLSKEEKASRNQEFMKEQAAYLADELGKLKGSVVKIGQMLALYGEHFLHPEITEALHRLNDSTASLSWPVVERALRDQLGSRLDDLEVSTTPIGTASLAQVHRATIKATGQQVVLKVQYPGVADAIDSDLSLFKHLLKVTNAVPQTKALDEWFNEISDLLKVEVDYVAEAQTTMRFYERLKQDERYVVPEVIEAYCTDRLLCLSFEEGVPVTNADLKSLPQNRRDALGKAAIDIMLNEIFVWGEMQTDPNFGNYLIRSEPVDKPDGKDKLILLDFGAMRQFDDELLKIARNLMLAGFNYDKQQMMNAMQGYEFFDTMSPEVKANMADVFLLATEPFRDPNLPQNKASGLIDDQGFYHWANSNLHKRLMESSGSAMQSREFSLPPKEFMFISRKFIGAYTFLTVLNARTNTYDTISQFVPINVTAAHA